MIKFRIIFFDYDSGCENIVKYFIDDVIERVRSVDYRNKSIRISENTILIRIIDNEYPIINYDYLNEINESTEFYREGFFQINDISIYNFTVDLDYVRNNIGFSNEVEYLTKLENVSNN